MTVFHWRCITNNEAINWPRWHKVPLRGHRAKGNCEISVWLYRASKGSVKFVDNNIIFVLSMTTMHTRKRILDKILLCCCINIVTILFHGFWIQLKLRKITSAWGKPIWIHYGRAPEWNSFRVILWTGGSNCAMKW